jgi:hypothetical protein
LFLVAGLLVAVDIERDVDATITISEDGVAVGRELWPWEKIVSLDGIGQDYTTHLELHVARAWFPRRTLNVRLGRAAYGKLALDVNTYLGSIGVEPKMSTTLLEPSG